MRPYVCLAAIEEKTKEDMGKNTGVLPKSTEQAAAQKQSAEREVDARATARQLATILQKQANILCAEILSGNSADDPEARDHAEAVMRAIDENDADLLAYYGIVLRYSWLDDIVSAIIHGDQHVRIQINMVGSRTTNDRTVAKSITKLFETVVTAVPHTTVERVGDYPHHNLKQLIARLQTSQAGSLVTDNDGNVYFKPTRHLLSTAALQDRGRYNELLTRGILIQQRDGLAPLQSLEVAHTLVSNDDTSIRVCLLDTRLAAEQDKVYVLLRALGITRQELYHNIFFDSSALSAPLVAYAIAILLEQHVQRFLHLLNYYDEWRCFDPYEYAKRNYGESLLPEDDQIIHGIVDAFAYIGIPSQSLQRVADVGTGPNLYSLMLVAPYVKAGASIDVLEFSEPNREYLKQTINNTIRPGHRRIWKKFERLMVEVGGKQYVGSEEATKHMAKIKFGDIFNLPQGRYDLLSSYFCTESVVDSNAPFRTTIQSLANALAPDGTLITAHMVGSEGYFAGKGTHFPALNLSIEDIAQAFRDADMEFVVVPVGEDAGKKAREGYHGMAFVVAFTRPCSKARQAALDRLAALPGSIRSTSSYDYSIEYCHIYTNESVSKEHSQSLEALDAITARLDAELVTYNLCVMVDDYSFPGQNFDYAKLLEWMEGKNARPHFLLREAELIPAAEETLRIMASGKRKRELTSYVKRKDYPCSLFIAAWYLARLGKLKDTPPNVTSSAERLINILPVRFDSCEREAREIIAATPFADCLDNITNKYLEGATLPEV